MSLLRLIGFAITLKYQVRKINVNFLIKQNILIVYMNMSFGNFYLFKSACIKYVFGKWIR